MERNLHDAMGVARNVMLDPRLVPGGGAVEMAISRGLTDRAASLQGVEQVSHSFFKSCSAYCAFFRIFHRLIINRGLDQ